MSLKGRRHFGFKRPPRLASPPVRLAAGPRPLAAGDRVVFVKQAINPDAPEANPTRQPGGYEGVIIGAASGTFYVQWTGTDGKPRSEWVSGAVLRRA